MRKPPLRVSEHGWSAGSRSWLASFRRALLLFGRGIVRSFDAITNHVGLSCQAAKLDGRRQNLPLRRSLGGMDNELLVRRQILREVFPEELDPTDFSRAADTDWMRLLANC
jgi:hypothetical protein